MANTISVPPVNSPSARRADGGQAQAVDGRLSRTESADSAAVAARVDGQKTRTQAATIVEAAQQVRDFLQMARRDLEFSVDKDSGTTVIRVLDAATGKLVRQIPPDEVLAMVKRLGQPEGVLFRGRA